MPSRLDALAPLAQAVEGWLSAFPGLAHPLNLCLDELLTNTITHGLGGASDHWIVLDGVCADGWLQLTLRDDAPPFDPFAEARQPDLTAGIEERPIGGLGVHFVRTLMDEVSASHDGRGNCITLRKRLDGAAGAPSPDK